MFFAVHSCFTLRISVLSSTSMKRTSITTANGPTRRQVLSGVGVGLGVAATAIYATTRDWAIVVPPLAWAGGLAAAMAIGAIAGLIPAIRAARLSPTEALRTL